MQHFNNIIQLIEYMAKQLHGHRNMFTELIYLYLGISYNHLNVYILPICPSLNLHFWVTLLHHQVTI